MAQDTFEIEVDARQLKWDLRFIQVAELVSTWSKDVSTKVGCVVVEPEKRVIRSTGYNGFARGVSDDARIENRELKYQLIVHAEENAILNAALSRVSLEGCVLYCTWPPCVRCARMIIQTGITGVAFPAREIPERWKADFELARNMLLEVGFGAPTYRSVPVA